GVAAEHRHAAGREVDDPRPAVGEHHAERDPGDERAGTEPEQDEQQDLLHVFICSPPGRLRRRLPSSLVARSSLLAPQSRTAPRPFGSIISLLSPVGAAPFGSLEVAPLPVGAAPFGSLEAAPGWLARGRRPSGSVTRGAGASRLPSRRRACPCRGRT